MLPAGARECMLSGMAGLPRFGADIVGRIQTSLGEIHTISQSNNRELPAISEARQNLAQGARHGKTSTFIIHNFPRCIISAQIVRFPFIHSFKFSVLSL